MEQQSNKNVWKLIIQTLITILTAIGTTLGVNAAV
ncbi:MAG: smalltalk protein [Parabacteroides sp.]|nr:smalltalk protein [Parabacteroides sp.]MDD6080131.1 smalltalk protein [bacterium]MCI7007954.1 smalltalk protein [Parabacteroides sp.]MCI7781921.1 smalltalk protein [Parabacteroides sp.]MDD7061779.1 smalltalk protein [bacterium]